MVVGGLVAKLCPTLEAPLSVEFSMQERWRGLPFPSPGDLPDPGISLASSTAGRLFTAEPPGKPPQQQSGKLLQAVGYWLGVADTDGMPVFSFEKLDYCICCLTLYLEDYFIIILKSSLQRFYWL